MWPDRPTDLSELNTNFYGHMMREQCTDWCTAVHQTGSRTGCTEKKTATAYTPAHQSFGYHWTNRISCTPVESAHTKSLAYCHLITYHRQPLDICEKLVTHSSSGIAIFFLQWQGRGSLVKRETATWAKIENIVLIGSFIKTCFPVAFSVKIMINSFWLESQNDD